MNMRQLGSILNNDINNILLSLSGADTTPAEYRKAVEHLLDTKPGVLAQNVGMPDPVLYPTSAATTFDKYHAEVTRAMWPETDPEQAEMQAAVVRALYQAGTDPLTITIETCRERGVLVLADYRMNAEDFYHGELDLYDFGRQHKHLRIPGANCLDPAHPEVFRHRMEIYREVAEEYDVDGIEFDFRRWAHMVSDPLKNHSVLTSMVRETRKMLDEVAQAKGRDRLILGVRVCPTLTGPSFGRNDMSCRELGLDVETWVKEMLVDFLSPSFFWGHNPGDDPRTAEFARLAEGTGVGVYPTVFPYSWWQTRSAEDQRIEAEDADRMRRYRDNIVEAALKCYEDGADGISTFNWVPHQQPGMAKRNIREGWGLGAAKLQMHIHRILRDRAALEAYYRSEEILP